ncbi:hypothetical protein RHSIM_Rhsim01G0238400 [Rhododendron simsii]|uniref:Uncharacterized protein n=1 Tax=Rhododendron simsii TaxID=118357 RepID=A0A834HR09_RHOSS|nr:hypothetical protein RHSIM_Rhsim01G0238400 [Rhododendron simsii]
MLNGALLVRCSRDLIKYSQCLSLGAMLGIPFYGCKDMEPKELDLNEEWYNFKSPTGLAYNHLLLAHWFALPCFARTSLRTEIVLNATMCASIDALSTTAAFMAPILNLVVQSPLVLFAVQERFHLVILVDIRHRLVHEMIKLSPSLGKDNLGLPVDQARLLAVYNFWVVLLASICCQCPLAMVDRGGGGSFVNCVTTVWFFCMCCCFSWFNVCTWFCCAWNCARPTSSWPSYRGNGSRPSDLHHVVLLYHDCQPSDLRCIGRDRYISAYTYLFSPDCKIFMEMVQEVAESQRTKDENKDASAAAGLLEKLSVEDKKSEEKAKDGVSLEAKEESEIEPGKTDADSKGEEPVSST